jgi:hypothetical protein
VLGYWGDCVGEDFFVALIEVGPELVHVRDLSPLSPTHSLTAVGVEAQSALLCAPWFRRISCSEDCAQVGESRALSIGRYRRSLQIRLARWTIQTSQPRPLTLADR